MVDSHIVSFFPPPPPGAERRVHQRVDVLAQVELLRGDAVVIAGVNNLSLGGAFLLHPDDDVALGEEVRVHLSAGNVDVVQRAKVVRIARGEPRGFAVAWVEAHAKTFLIVTQLMREQTTRVARISLDEVSPARPKAKKKSKSASVRRP